MFSQASLVKFTDTLSSFFFGSCDVFEFLPSTSSDSSSSFSEVLVHQSLPCKLSFSSSDISRDTSFASGISQVVTLFIAPDIIINSGSKIVVTQDSITTVYENSGVPLHFSTHQEIKLRLFTDWT